MSAATRGPADTERTAPTISAAGFFCLRTPLLPFDELTTWGKGLRSPYAAAAELAQAWSQDVRTLRGRLRAVVERPAVREAIALASSSLCKSLGAWLGQPESEHGQKVERSLVRYFARMSGRPTPFGLFAGISVGTMAASTAFELAAQSAYRRHSRLDSEVLARLTHALARDPRVRRALVYRPSSSLYRAAGRIRYAEARLDGNGRTYHLVAVEPTEYLETTLERAAQGRRLDALAEALADGEITRDDADAFVGMLVDCQLLVSDLAPLVTGAEPIHDLIAQLEAAPETRSLAAALGRTRAALTDLDVAPLGAPVEAYQAVASSLAGLAGDLEANLVQIDLTKPVVHATLAPEVVSEITRGIELLHRIAAPPGAGRLSAFREAFRARFDGRTVPLAEVLDEESGIGFGRSEAPGAEGGPLLEGMSLGRRADAEGSVKWGGRERVLLRLLETALRRSAREIMLDADSIAALTNASPRPLPAALSALATLAAPSEGALARGDFTVWLQGGGGPSGANLLGRFCHSDPALLGHVIEHLRAEESQRPEAVFAELVHLPEGRAGNLQLRPVLRRWEIPYLGRSGAPREQQLELADLLVSVSGDRVVLRSRRLGCEVIPRLTTAHHFTNPANLGVYRFLCALCFQDVPRLGFSWGALDDASFLPRVRAGRLVLSLARWRLFAEQLAPLGKVRGPERFAKVQALRNQLVLPRWVAVTDEDNILPVDLDNALLVETFVQLVKDRPSVVLTELFEPEGLCVQGPEGRFVHELVVPLVCAPSIQEPQPRPAAVGTASAITVPRTLPPGSDWLYAKLYTGAATADHVLREVVAPIVSRALESGAADAWFFVRYGDPDWHLRVRLRGEPTRLVQEVLPALHEVAAAGIGTGQIWKLQIDTYERELERYGGEVGMLLSEQVFHADSDAAVAMLETLAGDEGADLRWRLTLRGLDMLLADLGLGLDAKRALAQRGRRAFAREIGLSAAQERQLGARFRKERGGLEALLEGNPDPGGPLARGVEILRRRSPRLRPLGSRLRASLPTERVERIVASYLHMHANRMLRSAAREQELVLYDFLLRLYEGQAARERGAASRSVSA